MTSEYSVSQSIIVAAPVDNVWDTIKNFHDFSWAAGMVKTCEPVGNIAGSEPGAKRIANGVFHETLLELDEAQHEITYAVEDGPGPLASDKVQNYKGRMKLTQVADGTEVEWSATWSAADDAGVAFCNGMYKGLLKELQGTMAAKT